MIKKSVSYLLIIILFASLLSAQKMTSTFSGASGNISLNEEKKLSILAEGVFATQVTIKNDFTFRGDFKFITDNLFR